MSGYYLKWLRKGRVPSDQGGDPVPYRKWTNCVRGGWHACRWEDAVHHISDELWVCELDGPLVTDGDKVVAGRLRLVRKTPINDRMLRQFAADCAEDVLWLFERENPDDDRPRVAIRAARDYANGKIPAAARAAAGDAARDAARVAAGAAAWDAARAAAGAAARVAAGVAAGYAARAAAGAAARAAAGAAAGYAARAAAGAAAWDATRDGQSVWLLTVYAGLDDPAQFVHRGMS